MYVIFQIFISAIDHHSFSRFNYIHNIYYVHDMRLQNSPSDDIGDS